MPLKGSIYICPPCASRQHLGVHHRGSQHALCQCSCDGRHNRKGELRPETLVRPARRLRRR